MRVYKCIQFWVFMMIGCTLSSCSGGISCFKCTIAPLRRAKNETIRICSKFEENSHFQIYCPNSTMCMKRTIHHKLVNGTTVQTSVERGCAPQLDVGKAFDTNAKSWYDKAKIVEEVYEEGCFIGEDRGSPGGPPEYCFCGYHLCNGNQSLNWKLSILNIIIPSLIIIIRYKIIF